MTKEVVIIDYQACNLGSIISAVKELNLMPKVSSTPQSHSVHRTPIILPGVGSFEFAMKNLKNSGWLEALKEFNHQGKFPLVGICLGMQLFADSSTEGETINEGLCFVRGKVIRLPRVSGERIPNVGWRRVTRERSYAKSQGPESSFQYFVHSYYISGIEQNCVSSKITWGDFQIPVAIHRDHLRGFQYHPEKGGRVGLRHLHDSLSL